MHLDFESNIAYKETKQTIKVKDDFYHDNISTMITLE